MSDCEDDCGFSEPPPPPPHPSDDKVLGDIIHHGDLVSFIQKRYGGEDYSDF